MLYPSQPPYIRQTSLTAIRQILELQVLLDLLLQRLQGHHGLAQRGAEAWDQQQLRGLKPRLHRKSQPFLLQEHRGRRVPRVFQQRHQGSQLYLLPMWQTRVQQKFRGREKADLGIERVLKTMKYVLRVPPQICMSFQEALQERHVLDRIIGVAGP
jgi:hypothetical protein